MVYVHPNDLFIFFVIAIIALLMFGSWLFRACCLHITCLHIRPWSFCFWLPSRLSCSFFQILWSSSSPFRKSIVDISIAGVVMLQVKSKLKYCGVFNILLGKWKVKILKWQNEILRKPKTKNGDHFFTSSFPPKWYLFITFGWVERQLWNLCQFGMLYAIFL